MFTLQGCLGSRVSAMFRAVDISATGASRFPRVFNNCQVYYTFTNLKTLNDGNSSLHVLPSRIVWLVHLLEIAADLLRILKQTHQAGLNLTLPSYALEWFTREGLISVEASNGNSRFRRRCHNG